MAAQSTAQAVNDIRTALASNQLCVVVGAGVTVGATRGAKTADWKGLIIDAIDRCHSLGRRDHAWAERAKADVNSGYDVDMIVAAEKATEGLGGRGAPEYRRWLSQAIGGLRAEDSSVLDALVAMADAGALMATTNYDGLLEDFTGWPYLTWRDGPRLQSVLRGGEQAVIHIHGHWREPESVVFGSSSYADVLNDGGAAAFLKATVYARTLLFVGFGAGLADPNFSALRKWMRTHIPDSEYSHYRLVRQGDAGDMLHAPEEHIETVSYGPEYGDLGPFLAEIASGIAGAGMRGLEVDGGAREARDVSGTPVPLPPAPVDPARRDQLLQDVSVLQWVIDIAGLGDEEALRQIPDGHRVEEIRRFSLVFEEEIAQVLELARDPAALTRRQIERGLMWSRRLVGVLQESQPSLG